ncbi:interferon-induced protein with tetratricopeptide repeats 2-like [Sorex araneus]|uniref:interferon-induced protein with tetratricopeptide repeats 2-like n=1 Tax=Sorex araneus TaxID=42254 RepID=UPI002433D891|nr:interferon-induced protein with tetratricopeptide repeats 2-like [Sorex araneus]
MLQCLASEHHSDHVYFLHSEANSCLEQILPQLKCHFTWNLFKDEDIPEDLEDRVCEQIESLNPESKGTMYNLLAYIKHLHGQNEAALECLQQAEKSIQKEHSDQAEVRNLVTWGNYAWVNYHLGKLDEAQDYVDKVKQVCEKFSNPLSLECPELDTEEGWARLKCGNNQLKRAIVCFEKALEKHPHDPEFASGLAFSRHHASELAIETHCDSDCPAPVNVFNLLREAVELNPKNMYVKLLLALTLQKMNNAEGEKLVEEILKEGPDEAGVLQQAAKFYRTGGDLDKAIKLLKRASEMLPNSTRIHYIIGTCYREKIQKIFGGHNRMCQESEYLLQHQIEQGIDHFKKADNNRNLSQVNLSLAFLHAIAGEYNEAEHYYQREFSKDLSPLQKQQLHLYYGNFQSFQMKCEEKAIHHYMEGVKINHASKEKEKMIGKLYTIAKKRHFENRQDSQTLELLEFLQL